MVRTKTLWVKEQYLQLILAGRKTVEVRVGYSNITRLQRGDRLLLNGQHAFVVRRIARYASFEELLAQEDVEHIAPGLSADQLLPKLRAIYPEDKVTLGVVALEIEPATEGGDNAALAQSVRIE